MQCLQKNIYQKHPMESAQKKFFLQKTVQIIINLKIEVNSLERYL